MRPAVLVALLFCLAAGGVRATAAELAPVAVELRSVLPVLKRKTRVPVLLPSVLPYDRPKSGQNLRAAVSAGARRWTVSLFFGRNCGGANACAVGFLEGERGGKLFRLSSRVRLPKGIRGEYKPTTCGASCSPAQLDWRQGDVVYRYQLQVNLAAAKERAAMVRMASSAILAGPR